MAKKTTPIITHTEILARAIRTVEAEIDDWRSKCEFVPESRKEAAFEFATQELREKLDVLKVMYRLETGTDID